MKVTFELDMDFNQLADLFISLAKIGATPVSKNPEKQFESRVTMAEDGGETIILVKTDYNPSEELKKFAEDLNPAVEAPRTKKKTQSAEKIVEPKIEIAQIRKLAQEKIQAGHKEVIKAKVADYGVASISTVPEEKYVEFLSFLNAL